MTKDEIMENLKTLKPIHRCDFLIDLLVKSTSSREMHIVVSDEHSSVSERIKYVSNEKWKAESFCKVANKSITEIEYHVETIYVADDNDSCITNLSMVQLLASQYKVKEG